MHMHQVRTTVVAALGAAHEATLISAAEAADARALELREALESARMDAKREAEGAAGDLGCVRAELAEASHALHRLIDENEELKEDLEVMQEENGELEELKIQYEAQLEEDASHFEELTAKLEATQDELAVTKVCLTESEERQVRLMQEVAFLRDALRARDAEVARALTTNLGLVERLAALDVRPQAAVSRAA